VYATGERPAVFLVPITLKVAFKVAFVEKAQCPEKGSKI
jgi:hypothetical protein